MKKQSSKQSTVKTPVGNLKKGESIEHYNAVMLEEIRSQMSVLIEGNQQMEFRLQSNIDNLRTEFNKWFDLINDELKVHTRLFAEIRSEFGRYAYGKAPD